MLNNNTPDIEEGIYGEKRMLRINVTLAVLFVALSTLFAACTTPTPRERADDNRERANSRLEFLEYVIDPRPEPPICYALYGDYRGSMAPVPCAAVQHLLVNK